MHTWLTSLFIQLIEYLQQLWVHVVDGLEEREHSAVVGDAAATHVVALHAVKEGGDGVLQGLQELLMVLLRFSILILLLKRKMQDIQCTTWLNNFLDYPFPVLQVPLLCWWVGLERGFPLVGWLARAQPVKLEQEQRGWDSCEPLPVSSPSKFCLGNGPAENIENIIWIHRLGFSYTTIQKFFVFFNDCLWNAITW